MVRLAVVTFVMSIAWAAMGNGRYPATVDVHPHPSDADRQLLPATFGLLVTSDGGASYHWVCEAAIGYGGTYDPDYAVAADGSLFATSFDGLRVSRDGGCTWPLVAGEPGATFLAAVEIASDGDVWTAGSVGGADNGVYRSDDNGVSFQRTSFSAAGVYLRSLAAAPSRPQRVFATGADATPAAFLAVTDDDGASWTALPVADFALGASPQLDVVAVSPASPDVVYAIARGVNPPIGDAVYRSDDAGQNWSKILDTNDRITAFVARADDATLLAGTQFGTPRVQASADRGATWTLPVAQIVMGCAAERFDGMLLACGANWAPDEMALGRSTDAQAWQTLLEFCDIAGPLDCAPGTIQHDECVPLWPDLAPQLDVCGSGADAGPGADAAAAVDAGPPPDAAGTAPGPDCGCSAAFASAVLVWPVRRTRRARTRTPRTSAAA